MAGSAERWLRVEAAMIEAINEIENAFREEYPEEVDTLNFDEYRYAIVDDVVWAMPTAAADIEAADASAS